MFTVFLFPFDIYISPQHIRIIYMVFWEMVNKDRQLLSEVKISQYIIQNISWICEEIQNKSCQKTTMLAGRQPSLNKSYG